MGLSADMVGSKGTFSRRVYKRLSMSCIKDFGDVPYYCQSDIPVDTDCEIWNTAIKTMRSGISPTQTDPTKQQLSGNYRTGLANCYQTKTNMVKKWGATPLEIDSLVSSWNTQEGSESADGDPNCSYSKYGVFDTFGQRQSSNGYDYWNSMKSACLNGTMKDHPAMTTSFQHQFSYINDESDNGNSGSINMTFNCRDPVDSFYGQCKLPGWDYMGSSTEKGWVVDDQDMCFQQPEQPDLTKGYPTPPVGTISGAQAKAEGLGAPGKACDGTPGRCCVATDTTIGDTQKKQICSTCANNVQVGTGDMTKTNVTFYDDAGALHSLPYVGTQGIAITPTGGPGIGIPLDPSKFSDVRECYKEDGKFVNYCRGVTGCTGMCGGIDPTGKGCLVNVGNQCAAGLSNVGGGYTDPATNCPNKFTLNRQLGGQDGGSCTTTETIKDFTNMNIPEGSWTTGWHSESVNMALGDGYCADQDYQSDQKWAVQLGCAKVTRSAEDGSAPVDNVCVGENWIVRGIAAKYSVKDGTWTHLQAGPPVHGMDSSHSVTDPNSVSASMVANPNTNTCECHFSNVNLDGITGGNDHSFEGWQFGFMPGYYNSKYSTDNGVCNSNST